MLTVPPVPDKQPPVKKRKTVEAPADVVPNGKAAVAPAPAAVPVAGEDAEDAEEEEEEELEGDDDVDEGDDDVDEEEEIEEDEEEEEEEANGVDELKAKVKAAGIPVVAEPAAVAVGGDEEA
jgi:hypothetical protein